MKRNTSLRNKGFSLLEMTLALIVLSIALSAVIPNYVQGILRSRGEKTALDMHAIEEAARAYYIDQRTWPDSIDVLKEQSYLPASWIARSPFQSDYQLTVTPTLLTVSADVAEGVQNTVANRLPASTVAGRTVTSSIGLPTSGQELPSGAIIPWASAIIPTLWFLCDGQAVSRAENPGLFAALGTTYGAGDGTTTFNVPDLRGRTLFGLDATQTDFDTLGKKGGIKTVNISAHTHTISNVGSYVSWGAPRQPDCCFDGDAAMASAVNNLTAESSGISTQNVLNPYAVQNWIIKGQ